MSQSEVLLVLNLTPDQYNDLKDAADFAGIKIDDFAKDIIAANLASDIGNVSQFVEDRIDLTLGRTHLMGKATAVWQAYNEWCEESRLSPIGRNKFYETLASAGLCKRQGHGNTLCVYGGALKSSTSPEDDRTERPCDTEPPTHQDSEFDDVDADTDVTDDDEWAI